MLNYFFGLFGMESRFKKLKLNWSWKKSAQFLRMKRLILKVLEIIIMIISYNVYV